MVLILELIIITVNQLNFAAVKFRGLPISFYLAHFNFAFWYLRTKCSFPKMAVASLFMVRFSKFNLSLKLESKLHNTICAF